MGEGEMKFREGEPLAQGQAGVETEHAKCCEGMDSMNILRTKTKFVPFYFLQWG